jgi:dynein heavy chain
LSPKAVSTQDLYGYTSLATREWKDGVLSKIMRDLGNIPDELPKVRWRFALTKLMDGGMSACLVSGGQWIMLDGDLDANWIESMNSVMDDNKMLTLPSNERIPLKPHMRMIFEIRDLK